MPRNSTGLLKLYIMYLYVCIYIYTYIALSFETCPWIYALCNSARIDVFVHVPCGLLTCLFAQSYVMFPVTYLLVHDSDLPRTFTGRNDVQRCSTRTFHIMSGKHTTMPAKESKEY